MNQKVKLHIMGLQGVGDVSDAENPASPEIVVDAEYFQKDDKCYLVYEEQPEGHDSVSKCRIKFQKNYLELVRRGTVQTRMVFESGVSHKLNYQTPFGCLAMEVDTKCVQIVTSDSEIKILIEYTLFTEGEKVSDCKIRMQVCEA